MADVFTYVSQYGNRSIKESPFNELDNLAFCILAYLPFEKLVPELAGRKKLGTLREIAAALPKEEDECWIEQSVGCLLQAQLLLDMAKTRRYGRMIIKNYVTLNDPEQQIQFAAITIQMSLFQRFIAFRGTDNTFNGWKEDLMLSYRTPIPAQKKSVDYVNQTQRFFLGKIYIGGHSKGGNLAAYSAIFASARIQKHIVQVFNNDGPGFLHDMVERPEYKAALPKIHTFVPQSAIVGMLLEHEEEYTVIKSNTQGKEQHSLFTWETEENHFVTMEQVDLVSRLKDRAVKNWLEEIDEETREQFVEAFFTMIESSGVKDAQEILNASPKTYMKTLRSMVKLEGEDRNIIIKMLLRLLFEYWRTITDYTHG